MSQVVGGPGAGAIGGGDPSGVPEKPRRKYKKGDRTRRIWSYKEEEILAATLVELVALGWKSGNGFWTGYLQKCEESIRQEFSTSDIKGMPHIVDPKAKCMRHKSWPLWETWKCIFGKDGATGGGAENISVAAARLRDSGGGGSHCDESDSQPPFVAVPFTDIEPPKDENVAEQMSSGNTDKQPVARQAVFEKLSEVDGITTVEKYRLCNILGNKPQRLEMFMGMPVPARLGYLLALLEEG
ncbi:hypothetical protein SASPL_146884 [Salvia splendens]|uniref:Myb/SANT-like domain-containing protein n=1 Tax=Salvia splendens TaxID=180675 RepID=A0A8X8WDK1_SALSN|nr:hypothetical protein SASPL_146884 [Salvia splendens]